MTVARYIALSLISRYHCLDPTNCDILGLHCITVHRLSIQSPCYMYEVPIYQGQTRTTRMSAFWGHPKPPHYSPYYCVMLDPKPKQDKVKVIYLKNLLKFQILEFWNKLYKWHLDKMYKYEMDPVSIVIDTEQTRFCPQTDRLTDGQDETSIYPLELHWA